MTEELSVQSVVFVAFFLLLGLLAVALFRLRLFRGRQRRNAGVPSAPQTARDDSSYQVSYAPPEFEWSGTTTGALPFKTLTYKQYECLEDARYGFKIVGVPPSERKQPQPHKTRAHGLKTVGSLLKHGFLDEDGEGSYVITDHGLNALEVCNVRY